jgi:hypothetical protein
MPKHAIYIMQLYIEPKLVCTHTHTHTHITHEYTLLVDVYSV